MRVVEDTPLKLHLLKQQTFFRQVGLFFMIFYGCLSIFFIMGVLIAISIYTVLAIAAGYLDASLTLLNLLKVSVIALSGILIAILPPIGLLRAGYFVRTEGDWLSLDFDRQTQLLIYSRGYDDQIRETVQHPLGEIISIEMEEIDWSNDFQPSYQLILHLTEARKLVIGDTYLSNQSLENVQKEIGDRVRHFLRLAQQNP